MSQINCTFKLCFKFKKKKARYLKILNNAESTKYPNPFYTISKILKASIPISNTVFLIIFMNISRQGICWKKKFLIECDPVLTVYLFASYLDYLATRYHTSDRQKRVQRVLKERRWRMRKFCNRFAICIHFSFNVSPPIANVYNRNFFSLPPFQLCN